MSDADARLEHALTLAYHELSRRERTVSEMRALLERREVPSAIAERTIATLCAERTLDDQRFAQLYAQDKRTLEGWGSARIKRGLLARGVEPELAASACAEQSLDGEREQALSLLARRFPAAAGQPLPGRRERERALGVLLRKGYDYELSLEVLRAYASSPPGEAAA